MIIFAGKRQQIIGFSTDPRQLRRGGGIVGCLGTGILTSAALGGTGYAEGVTMLKQVGIQAASIGVCILWSGIVAYVAFKIADVCVGLRVSEEVEREGLDVNSHGERAYNQ